MGSVQIKGDSNVIKAHPLSANPDRCYEELTKKGRYNKILRDDVNALGTEKAPNTVRFVCISDTHNQTENLEDELPSGDVLIHAGDFTQISAKEEIIHFNEFLGKVKDRFSHVLVIAGNHEMTFDPSWYPDGAKYRRMFGTNPLNAKQSKEMLTNCTYIEDETIELYGIKIYGSPWQPEYADLGFNENRGSSILERWDKIPNDTDILVTHGPPLGIGDKCFRGNRAGCAELLLTIMDRVKPKYHIYGHIHEDYGIWNDGITRYINASTCTFGGNPEHKPIVFDYERPGSSEKFS